MLPPQSKEQFVGIDVSKNTLDVCILPRKEQFQVNNDGQFDELIQRLKVPSNKMVVLEPTGGYEQGVLGALIKAGIPVSREHASRIFYHSRAYGRYAKTDRLDAYTIAHYAQVQSGQITALSELPSSKLQQLTSRREDLVGMRASEKNRIQNPAIEPLVKQSCEELIQFLCQKITEIEQEIKKVILENKLLMEKKSLLLTVPGVGETISSIILSFLPELGTISHKKIAALVGVAPYSRQSGQYYGQQHIFGGRRAVRNALFMSTLTAIRYNPTLKNYYEHLIARGKKGKVAVIACLHKLLRILNAMLAKQTSFKTA